MTPALTAIAPTVGKLLRLLASDRDGEVLASARALQRVLQGAGLDLHDLANVIHAPARQDAPDWRGMVRECALSDHLSEREAVFVVSLMRWRGEPTAKQLKWLSSIYVRVREDA